MVAYLVHIVSYNLRVLGLQIDATEKLSLDHCEKQRSGRGSKFVLVVRNIAGGQVSYAYVYVLVWLVGCCVDTVRCYVLAIIFVPCGHFEQRPRLLRRRPLVEARPPVVEKVVVTVLLGVSNDFKHSLDLILPRLERLGWGAIGGSSTSTQAGPTAVCRLLLRLLARTYLPRGVHLGRMLRLCMQYFFLPTHQLALAHHQQLLTVDNRLDIRGNGPKLLVGLLSATPRRLDDLVAKGVGWTWCCGMKGAAEACGVRVRPRRGIHSPAVGRTRSGFLRRSHAGPRWR